MMAEYDGSITRGASTMAVQLPVPPRRIRHRCPIRKLLIVAGPCDLRALI